MDRKVKVLGKKRYSFLDKDTGETRKGVTVHYLDLESLNDDTDTKGTIPAKSNLAYEQWESIPIGDCKAELDFILQGNKPQIRVVKFTK